MRREFIAVALFALVAAVAITMHSSWFFLLRTKGVPLMEQESLWKERIASVGGPAAYLDFQKAEQSVAEPSQHQYAHVFGAALYDVLGTAGVGVCDMQFQFGCLHAYFGHLIAEHGVTGITQVADDCQKQTGILHPCEHAVGHGLLSYYGYNEPALKEALALCAKDFTTDPVNGCTGGVFMEYNLYTALGLTSHVRDAAKDGWYSPCTDLGAQFQQSCYWWLPQWWHEYLRLSIQPRPSATSTYETMGARCAGAPNALDRRSCYEQIGQLTVWNTNFEASHAIELCDVASVDPAARLECRSYLAYMLNYYTPNLSAALSACDGLTGDSLSFCQTYARHDAYIPKDLPLPSDL